VSKERTVKPFRLAAGVVRDKDNAQPREPRPQFMPNDHPRLAPPGMSGIRNVRLVPVPPPPQKRLPKAVFKSLAPAKHRKPDIER
jgi:hypothetical protein